MTEDEKYKKERVEFLVERISSNYPLFVKIVFPDALGESDRTKIADELRENSLIAHFFDRFATNRDGKYICVLFDRETTASVFEPIVRKEIKPFCLKHKFSFEILPITEHPIEAIRRAYPDAEPVTFLEIIDSCQAYRDIYKSRKDEMVKQLIDGLQSQASED